MSQTPSSHAKAAAPKRSASRPALTKRVRDKYQSCGRGIGTVSRRLRVATGTFSKHVGRGDVDEEKNVVLQKDLKQALGRCSVHLLAVSATTALAYFNLAGFFIGSEYQGLTGGVYQALDTLCLQVTAKLVVIVITFSTTHELICLLLAGTTHRRLFGNHLNGYFTSSLVIWKRRLAFRDLGLQTTIHRCAVSHISGISVRARRLRPPP